MPTTSDPAIELVGWTTFRAPDSAPWQPQGESGEDLIQFAGRACYQSWSRPNPATATNAGYIAHIVDVGHFSVLEHAQATFYLTGVSRSLTHELVRHRHFSVSQLSQRYVDESDAQMVVPHVIAADPLSLEIFRQATEVARDAYEDLAERLTTLQADTDLPITARRKAARQAARAVLPNATETRIVVTGNVRSWRHFIDMRATAHADVEICEVAMRILLQLREIYPSCFADYEYEVLPDGREVAASTRAEQA